MFQVAWYCDLLLKLTTIQYIQDKTIFMQKLSLCLLNTSTSALGGIWHKKQCVIYCIVKC